MFVYDVCHDDKEGKEAALEEVEVINQRMCLIRLHGADFRLTLFETSGMGSSFEQSDVRCQTQLFS